MPLRALRLEDHLVPAQPLKMVVNMFLSLFISYKYMTKDHLPGSSINDMSLLTYNNSVVYLFTHTFIYYSNFS